MNTVRLNITLPVDIATSIKEIRNKSAFITTAIRMYLEEKKKEQLLKELKEGYQATTNEDAELLAEWDSAINDGIG